MLAKVLILILPCTLVAASHSWDEDKHSAPQPYRFGYEVKDKEGAQYRHEEGDGHGSVKGSYGYTDDKGLYREVHYVADKGGFRAKVKTNEPGTSNQDSANVEYVSNPKYQDVHHVRSIPEVHHGYHKVNIAPVYHKAPIAPIRPIKHFENYKSYNLNNFSPVLGYSYGPNSLHKYKSLLGHGNDFGKHIGGYQYSSLHHGDSFGLSNVGNLDGFGQLGGLGSSNSFGSFNGIGSLNGVGNLDGIGSLNGVGNLHGIGSLSGLGTLNGVGNLEGFGNLDSYSNDEVDKIIEEVKNKRHHSNVGGGFSGFDDFSGFQGFSNDGADKILEELKNKKKYDFPSDHKSYGSNDFHIKEFRNIGNHKYSRSS